MKESRAKPKNNIVEKFDKINTDTSVLDIVKVVCSSYCEQLDEYMKTIDDTIVTRSITEISTVLIEEWILNITSILYFTISGLEEVGIKEDMCKSIRQELYTKAHSDASGTVAEKTNKATLAVQEEDLVLQIYSRAYKRIKQKVDAGYEMLNSMKKVMSARITDGELSNSRYNGKEVRE